MFDRWKNRPEHSTWGDFGEDDCLGKLNLITPEQTIKGIAEVKEGRVFSLSLPLELPGGTSLNPNRYPPIVRPNLRAGHVNFNVGLNVAYPGASDLVSDDLVVLHTQYSTQWDAFGHAGAFFDADGDGVAEKVYYNGWRGGIDSVGPDSSDEAGVGSLSVLEGADSGHASTSNAGPVGISHMAVQGVQGRAVLIDLEAHLGSDYRIVGFSDLARIMAEDNIKVEEGDIVLLHTGFGKKVLEQNGSPAAGSLDVCAVLDGADPDLQEWIATSGLAALAADNYAVEAFPATKAEPGDPVLPLHEFCLFRQGIHLGELWWLSDLASHLRNRQRSRFLLTAPPLRLPGTTGSPLTPIATV